MLLAYGAGHEPTVEPRTYTFDVEAPGYAPLRREVTVPRETDEERGKGLEIGARRGPSRPAREVGRRRLSKDPDR